MSHPLTLVPMLKKLQLWTPLDVDEQAVVLSLPHTVRRMRAHEFIVREDDRPRHSCLLLSGFAFRHKVAGNGGRQIFSIHMRGDVIDLHNSMLRRADHNVQALTDVEAAFIPVAAIESIVVSHPVVGKAMWYETLVDASIFREWTLNVGRRDARTRMAHMLCEFALRLKVAGLGERMNYKLPMTQDQLADALGLTSVHVNRMLKNLEHDGFIERSQRSIRIVDFTQLSRIGDFDPAYLHLEQAERDETFIGTGS